MPPGLSVSRIVVAVVVPFNQTWQPLSTCWMVSLLVAVAAIGVEATMPEPIIAVARWLVRGSAAACAAAGRLRIAARLFLDVLGSRRLLART